MQVVAFQGFSVAPVAVRPDGGRAAGGGLDDDDDGRDTASPLVEHLHSPVSPMSMHHFGLVEDDGPLSVPSVMTEVVAHSPLLPPLRQPRFVSASQPCSAASSPLHPAMAGQLQGSSSSTLNSCPQSPSRTPPRLSHSRSQLHRSMSYVGRPSSSVAGDDRLSSRRNVSLSRLMDAQVAPDDGEMSYGGCSKPIERGRDSSFSCNILCMHLPGFSKKKPVQVAVSRATSSSSRGSAEHKQSSMRAASLEKFECGSWSSPAVADAVQDPALEFPVELTACNSTGNIDEPVHAAFVFDNAAQRGILKKSSSQKDCIKRLHQVKFSAEASSSSSSPSSPCITPRMHKVRDELSIFH